MTDAKPSRDIVALYEEVARITDDMLSAAHRQDWDQLVALEAGCAHCVESMKGCPMPTVLGDEARRQKISLLKTILANDREIRNLTDPWMQRVSQLLGGANTECRVNRSYRNDGE